MAPFLAAWAFHRGAQAFPKCGTPGLLQPQHAGFSFCEELTHFEIPLQLHMAPFST